jgi:catechol 2,3-dioxygenase-like lactoylglutathione lyase family enzyme
MRLEVVVIPVADVDRAKVFYKSLGWREDADAGALRSAAAAHGQHEQEIGHADPDWPDWYAQYMVDQRDGPAGPAGPGTSA